MHRAYRQCLSVGRVWLSSFTSFFFFQAEDGIRDLTVTGVQTCALPISSTWESPDGDLPRVHLRGCPPAAERARGAQVRSEEHTSELQSQSNLVCRLLLEKKKKKIQ